MDDDDKIRRNLVVTSTVLIAIAWLDVPLPLLLEKAFSFKSTPDFEIRSWKIWVLVLSILAYFAWRYRWSDDFTEGWKEHERARQQRFSVLFNKRYLAKVSEWVNAGVFPNDVHEELPRSLEMALEQTGKRPGRRPLRISMSATDLQFDSPRATLIFHVEWPEPPADQKGFAPQNMGSPSYARLPVLMDSRRHSELQSQAKRFAHYNSKASMALLWPLGLSSVAGGIALFRLVRSFFGS